MSITSDNDPQRGERELIREILSALPSSPEVVVPPGDDCASVKCNPGDELVLTSDPVILGTHFDASASPAEIGHKAAGRVISDLAAMGSLPRWLLLNTTAPSDYPPENIKAIVAGAQDLASSFDAAIVGGDLSCSDTLAVHAFACGILPAGSAIRRTGAGIGDRIYVTGELGDSRSGKHLHFVPRAREGIWLREQSLPSAMIDTSDGPATDLRHLLDASGIGARLHIADIPCASSLAGLALEERFAHAMCDGEDFELLFTVPEDVSLRLEADWSTEFDTPLTRIGSITGKPGEITAVDPNGRETLFSGKGFDHFA